LRVSFFDESARVVDLNEAPRKRVIDERGRDRRARSFREVEEIQSCLVRCLGSGERLLGRLVSSVFGLLLSLSNDR